MAATTNSRLTKITPVDPWPERKEPQAAFDSKVRTSMNQMSTMIAQLNGAFIPEVNDLCAQLNSQANTVNQLAIQTADYRDAASKSAASAQNSANAASASATQAQSSATSAQSYANNANINATAAQNSAKSASATAATVQSKVDAAKTEVVAAAQTVVNNGKAEVIQAAQAKVDAATYQATLAKGYAKDARDTANELYNLEIVVDKSPIHTGAAVIDRDKNTLTISIPPGEDGKVGPPALPDKLKLPLKQVSFNLWLKKEI